MAIKIRKARVSDRSVIARFNALLASETEGKRLPAARLHAGVKALLSSPAKGIYFVGEMNKKVVGQVLITYEWSDWRNGNFWWIQSVYVDGKHRGQGIFRALFEHIVKLAKSRKDVCGLRLYMDAHNQTARQAYDRLGFKLTNYQMFESEFERSR
jgi:GNAT superfamily N-acetyltransferase